MRRACTDNRMLFVSFREEPAVASSTPPKHQQLSQAQVSSLVSRSPSFKGTKTAPGLRPEEVGDLITRTPSFRSKKSPDMAPVEVRSQPDMAPEQKSPQRSPIRPMPSPVRTQEPSLPSSQIPQKDNISPTAKSDEGMNTAAQQEQPKREKVKRTLSLKTKRQNQSQSFKDKYRLPAELPPSEMEGFLERKQELQSGGKKATIRSWRNYYTVLCGQLLCFFKDRHGKQRLMAYCSLCIDSFRPLKSFFNDRHGMQRLIAYYSLCTETPSNPSKVWNLFWLIQPCMGVTIQLTQLQSM